MRQAYHAAEQLRALLRSEALGGMAMGSLEEVGAFGPKKLAGEEAILAPEGQNDGAISSLRPQERPGD